MNPPIVVRLAVDTMRQEILHAFSSRQLELSQILAAELDRILADEFFMAEVRAETQRMVRQAIADTMRRVVNDVVWKNAEWQDEIAIMVREEFVRLVATRKGDQA